MSALSTLHMDQPVRCRIRVQGAVAERWRDWLDGMEIMPEVPDEARVVPQGDAPCSTWLSGTLPDQAALLGLLQRLYSLGYPILNVEVQVL